MHIEQAATHLDHMIRQTRIHHMQLSSMADLKANMLLTMAAVVITLSIPYTLKQPFVWGAVVLITFCLLTVLLATYATMPKIATPSRGSAAPDIGGTSFNLLFFGDFVQLDYEHFEAAMEQVMNDPSRAYQVQIKEVYALGRYLADKKYRFVRLAYLSFMTGILTSGIVLLLTAILG